MVYKCGKCKFIFERKNEPSKCPNCEGQNVVEANDTERQELKHLVKQTSNDAN